MVRKYNLKLEKFKRMLDKKGITRVVFWDNDSGSPVICQCCGALVHRHLVRLEVGGEYPNCEIYYIGLCCASNLELI